MAVKVALTSNPEKLETMKKVPMPDWEGNWGQSWDVREAARWMETHKNTTIWTPAPDRTSPSRIAMFEYSWDDDDEEEDKGDEDFVSQMDENGIIGLSEALEDVELGENDGDAQCPGPFTPEQAAPSECVRDNPSEELNSDLSEHPYHTESAGEDALPSSK